jgi:chemotaxis protein methyltransferase CheR
VVPALRTYPFIRIWHAGCSTGEEAYSMAILLEEEDLYDRTRIYATDINEVVIRKAKEGIFPLDRMQEYTQNYLRAGGTRSFSEYYTAMYDGALFAPRLMRNIVFSQHNLVTDRSFAECNVILCRNVLIYFDRELQHRVHKLFHESLPVYGYLGLGSKESLRFTGFEDNYEPVDRREKIYRKIK